MRSHAHTPTATAVLLIAVALACPAAAAGPEPAGAPLAAIDLTVAEGLRAVKGQWRYSDAKIVEVDFRSAGADRKPTGPPNRTWDIVPHAGGADFDDSAWEPIEPSSLVQRRSTGKVSFNWYRLDVTIPERAGSFDTTGSTVVLDVVVDDYAEIWVDGRLPRDLDRRGGALVAGWNAPNRIVLTSDARPGRRVRIAVFGINGPISDPPLNYIWVRSARLEFFPPSPGEGASGEGGTVMAAGAGEIVKRDDALDDLVPAGAKIEKLAGGFSFTEGPLWVPDPAGGYLLFSDPNRNIIYRLLGDGRVMIFRSPSGYTGADIAEYGQPGSNGLALDPRGRLTIDEHGNRRVTRLEKDGSLTVLADRYEGRRLNSPNDLVYRSDGALYFTDPPFGLPGFGDDPRKELPFSGLFLLKEGRLVLLDRSLAGPNGLAFSPDERYLYVDNWDLARKVVMRHAVNPDGTLGPGELFFDMTGAPGEEALDGLKVDERGNLYVSGPGGVWILSPKGKHIGTIRAPELPANFAWGDDDGRALYMTARTGIYRLRLNVAGAGRVGWPR